MTTENTTPETPTNDEGKTLVTVKFRSAGKQYDFDTNDLNLSLNDEVVVETTRGRALGTVIREVRIVEKTNLPSDLKKVLRLATEADINMARISSSKEKEALDYCFERIRQRKMPMKLVKAEYLFDGSKIIFYFTADGRVDFRDLVKDLAQYFHTRIEMRQIGVRDEAKLIGGIGICGRELCCGTFLTDFHPVSVRMAKQQGLALNPTKISGQCGRLLCCLGYEYETYCTLAKNLPKQGTKVTVDGKAAEVLSSQTLAQTVTVRSEGKVITNIPMSKLSSCKCPHAKTNQAEPGALKSDDKRPAASQKTATKSQARGDSQPNRVQKGTKPKDKNTPTKAGEPRQQRPNRNKPPRNRPTTDTTATKSAAEQRPSRPKKEGQQNQEGQAVPTQRPQRPQKQRTNRRPSLPTDKTQNRDQAQTKVEPKQNNQDGAQPAPSENGETKSIKRRSRNRRRPPRKP